MINHYANINNIPLYIDKYMEDNKVLKGRKGNSDIVSYFIANPKTAELIYQLYQLRKHKLERILNDGTV